MLLGLTFKEIVSKNLSKLLLTLLLAMIVLAFALGAQHRMEILRTGRVYAFK